MQTAMFRIYILIVMVICAIVPKGMFAPKQKTYKSALEELVEEEFKEELRELEGSEGSDKESSGDSEKDSALNDLRRNLGYGPTSERVALDYNDDALIEDLINDMGSTEVDYE